MTGLMMATLSMAAAIASMAKKHDAKDASILALHMHFLVNLGLTNQHAPRFQRGNDITATSALLELSSSNAFSDYFEARSCIWTLPQLQLYLVL
jgi:hypothetical protein